MLLCYCVGSVACILGISSTWRPSYLKMKLDIKLWFISGICKAFVITSSVVSKVYEQSYAITASTISIILHGRSGEKTATFSWRPVRLIIAHWDLNTAMMAWKSNSEVLSWSPYPVTFPIFATKPHRFALGMKVPSSDGDQSWLGLARLQPLPQFSLRILWSLRDSDCAPLRFVIGDLLDGIAISAVIEPRWECILARVA